METKQGKMIKIKRKKLLILTNLKIAWRIKVCNNYRNCCHKVQSLWDGQFMEMGWPLQNRKLLDFWILKLRIRISFLTLKQKKIRLHQKQDKIEE